MFIQTPRGAVFLVGVALSLSARRAGAEETRVHLAWVRGDDAGGCVGQREIEAGVAARLGRNPFADDGALSIEGFVEHGANVWRADIRVRDSHGALVGRRTLDTQADDCKPLAEAVILAIALVIDPNAAGRPPGGALPIAAAAPQPPPPAPPAPACPAAPPCPPASPCPACATIDPSRARANVFARVLAGAGLLPRVAVGPGLFGAYVAPSFEVTASLFWLPDVATADDRFAFGLVAGGPGACYRFPLGTDAALAGCGELQLGSQHAVVRDVNLLTPLEPGDHLWVAAAAGPRLTVESGPLRLEAGVTGLVPITPKEFRIQGSSASIFHPSPVAGVAFLGLGFGTP